jgi:hypothetical protein
MQNSVQWMLEQMRWCHPSFSPNAVMMDDDLSEHNAVAAHFITRAYGGLKDLQALLQAGELVEWWILSISQAGSAAVAAALWTCRTLTAWN